MNECNVIFVVIILLVILLCTVVVLFERYKIKKMLETLNQMLDSVLDGSFTEQNFDESLLSAVENRLYRYLTASEVSARNLAVEKEKIKELIADISHQTKTPIANILLYAQLLEEQELPQQSMDCVMALRGQAEKLNFLIASLVKLSRLETGVFTLRPVYTAITPMLEDTVEQFLPKVTQKGLQLIIEPTEAYAIFDYKWTQEALCNLVDNAIKYTPPGGRIQISVKEYNLFCRIDVADTGIGISEEEQAKVFSRFYRSPSVSEQDGVGIGLYLTRQILSEQGGYIKVTSSLGRGSVFSMFLPRED
ncbi:sensor histidine kinase [Defluviitalea raffinosedens]|uniref:histidine kinase n=1 Tax=Defluviitalea raffinosedens TaxID=1450156 RepID=A0A7C8LJL7_9FIRM|nr:HAMP domain-containing sensor histidine kinase [Defluviitalea raffinosedens]KAE9634860.1 sensor histidine kinase [Defluviitalea raffinosedens]MBM7687023.1 signal transduction histidine kinase [Defluviitalea raffinosedens]